MLRRDTSITVASPANQIERLFAIVGNVDQLFVAMAIANEAMRRSLSFDTWLAVKVWGVTIISVIFAAANIPMLMRHGLKLGDEPASDDLGETTPPQG